MPPWLVVGSWLTHGKCGMCAQSPNIQFADVFRNQHFTNTMGLTSQNEPTPYSQERRIVSAKQILLPTRVPHGPLAVLKQVIFLVAVCQEHRKTAQTPYQNNGLTSRHESILYHNNALRSHIHQHLKKINGLTPPNSPTPCNTCAITYGVAVTVRKILC